MALLGQRVLSVARDAMETKLTGDPGKVLRKSGRMLDQRTKHHVVSSSLYDLKPS